MKALLFAASVAAGVAALQACDDWSWWSPPSIWINFNPPPPFFPPARPPNPPINTWPPPARPPPPPRPPPTMSPTQQPTMSPTKAPTAKPTPKPTATPTARPTPKPTPKPTPTPTPPPPPPPFIGYVPTPPRDTMANMERTQCVRRVDFSVDSDSPPDQSNVKEIWTYVCSFKMYITVNLRDITEATPCACGVNVDIPANPSTPGVSKALDTQVTMAKLVIYDEIQRQVLADIPEYSFIPNDNTTAEIAAAAADPLPDFSKVIQGFSGVAKPFEGRPALLDRTIPGNENNRPALCFEVVQTFQSEYKWPEPPKPKLDAPPAVYMSNCIPLTQENVHAYKRHTAEANAASKTWWREFYVFADELKNGKSVFSRYITSYYVNQLCSSDAGYFSHDRHFTTVLDRSLDVSGVFRWTRSFGDQFLIGGVPESFTQMDSFLSTGYYKVKWTQKWSILENGKFQSGMLYNGLMGLPDANTNGFSGDVTKVCTSVPAAWRTCEANTPGCAFTDAGMEMNDQTNGPVYLWPYDEAQANETNCLNILEHCNDDVTWLSFQNFGTLQRDFSKYASSHLLTGPRSAFCHAIATTSVAFDSLVLQPFQSGMMIRKRGELSGADAFEVKETLDFRWKRATNTLSMFDAPVVGGENVVKMMNAQPATGSAKEDGTAANDHPLRLFTESYTVPFTVDPEDMTCGGFEGGDFYAGCQGKIFGKLPPCFEGSQGCSCRTISARGACDGALQCGETGICVKPACAAGEPGCDCSSGSCNSGSYMCSNGHCIVDDSACPMGTAGCKCHQDGNCDSGVCSEGICYRTASDENGNAVADLTCAGSAGCLCSNSTCFDGNMQCHPSLGACVTKSLCNPGSGGCSCQSSRCASGFECTAENVCVKVSCPAGSRGCPCLAGDRCSDSEFTCQSLRTDGTEKACVARLACGDQSQLCLAYCGEGNVRRCPACPYEKPICKTTSAAGAGSSGSSIVASFALVAVALALALF